MHFPLPALTASYAECVVFMLTRQSEGSLGQSDAVGAYGWRTCLCSAPRLLETSKDLNCNITEL